MASEMCSSVSFRPRPGTPRRLSHLRISRTLLAQRLRELIDAGKAAYKASQTRNQETVSDVSNQLADACLQCHERYRDKPGGTTADPSNKAARCF